MTRLVHKHIRLVNLLKGLLVIALLTLTFPGNRLAFAAGSDGPGFGFDGKQDPEDDYIYYFPLIYKGIPDDEGVIYGFVIDAGSGLGIDGAQVCYETNCAISGSDGSYELHGLPPGLLSFDISATEYVALSESVMIALGQDVYHQFTLSKSLLYLTDVFIRIVVTWRSDQYFQTPDGLQENDLDLHMWLDNGILVEHIYSGVFGDCTIFPNMCIKIDSRLGSGPETLDISELEKDGIYEFGVYNVNYPYYPGYIPPLAS